MTHFIIPRFGRILAATMLFCAVALVTPAVTMADDAPAHAAKTAKVHDRIEAHIASLRHSLRITAAQDSQWQAVATVMRDNAKSVAALIKERSSKMKTMTAIDDLNSYEAIADAHAAGVKALIPAFQALYDTMSDAQKRNADAVFRHRPKASHKKMSG